MWLLDQWAERHILDALHKGEFENLSGAGAPLELDDDAMVPAELRTAFRLLKNAGYLPPALQQRKEALELSDLLDRPAAPRLPGHQQKTHAPGAETAAGRIKHRFSAW